MYNKRTLNKDTKASKEPKSISTPRDIIYDPMGQWTNPYQPTRVPGSNMTMQGVPYAVLGIGSTGQQQMMYPGAEYMFPGADYVDEYPMMQIGGSATAADSLAVANSAREVANYYTNKNYSLDSAWEKFTDGSTARSLYKDHLDPFWTKTKKETYNERLKELKDYPSPEGSAGYYDYKYKTGPKKGQLIPYEDYFKQINDHQYKQREEKNLIMDTRSPMPLYDTRIYPSGQVYLINEDKKDPYFRDQVTFPLYDPLAVTPWNMLSAEDKKLRLEIYGSEGTPIKGYAPNESKAENRLKELYKSNPQQKKEPNLNTDLAAWLKTQGASASYADRKKLYEQATGKTDYKGTSEQNIGLLNLVKEKGLDYKINNLEKVPSNTSDETAFVKSLSKMPERSEESVETPITPLPVKEEPKELTRQVPKTEWKQLPDGTWYKDTKAGQNATVESAGTDIGGRSLQNGGSIYLELTDEEIEEYRRGGYIVEEYAIGGEGGGEPTEPKPAFKKTEKFYDEVRELEEGRKLYKSYKEELLKLKRLKEKEEQDVRNKKQNILNIAQSLTENPRPTRTNLDYIAPSDYYCNTRSCEIFQDAGLTIPEGTEPFTVNKKVYKPGDQVPIIPGNMQMKGVLKNLGFLPVDESNLKPGDLAQEEVYKSRDYQGNTFSPRFVPSHSMIKANKDYYNAPGGDRTNYEITPISFYGEKGKDWRIQGYRYEGALPYYNNLLKDVQSKFEQYSQYADKQVEQLPIKRDAYLLNNLSKVPESILPSSTVDWQNKRKEEIKNSEFSSKEKRKLYKSFKQQGGTIPKFQTGDEKKPLPNLFNFDPTPEYVGYQGNIPASESTRVVNTYRPTQQEIKATKEYTQKVGATAQAIRNKTGVSQKEAMQQAEQVLDANSRVPSEAKPYANTKQAQERDAYVFDEGMNARDYFRYPLQFLSGNLPTQEERIQDRIRITDPRTSRLDKFMGTVGEAGSLAPEALLNTGIGLAFAPANLSKLGMVADAVSPIGNPFHPDFIKSINKAGDYLTTQTPLKNAYKLNPKANKQAPLNTLYHGSQDPNLQIDDIIFTDVNPNVGARPGSFKKRAYSTGDPLELPGGFYTNDLSIPGLMGNSDYRYSMNIPANAKVFEWGPGISDNISVRKLQELKSKGYDIIKGKNIIGQTEYIPLNRDIISNWKKFETGAPELEAARGIRFETQTPHWLKGYKPVETPISPFNTRAQNDLLVEQARRSGEAPLPDYMEPYISRRYTPAAKEQDIFESFLSPKKQAELRKSRTQTFTPEGVNTPKQLPSSGKANTNNSIYFEVVPEHFRGKDAYKIKKNDKWIGDFDFEQSESGDWVIGNVGLNNEYKRKGLGKEAFIYANDLLKNQGRGLLHSSGNFVGNDAKYVWESLVKEGKAEKIGPDSWRFINTPKQLPGSSAASSVGNAGRGFKQQGGIVLDLSEDEIRKYLEGGYIVEEL